MNEKEANIFIENQVAMSFKRQMVRLFTIFGIANFLALATLYFIVLDSVSKTTKDAAKDLAEEKFESNDRFLMTLTELKEKIWDQYTENANDMAETTGRLKEFNNYLNEKTREVSLKISEIEENWDLSSKKLVELNHRMEISKNSNAGKLLDVMIEFEKSNNLKTLLEKVNIISHKEIMFGDIYVCWDSLPMESPKGNVRSITFSFPKKFKNEPVLIPAVSAQGPGHAFAVYSLNIKDNKTVSISANEINERQVGTPATLSYIAVGQIDSNYN